VAESVAVGEEQQVTLPHSVFLSQAEVGRRSRDRQPDLRRTSKRIATRATSPDRPRPLRSVVLKAPNQHRDDNENHEERKAKTKIAAHPSVPHRFPTVPDRQPRLVVCTILSFSPVHHEARFWAKCSRSCSNRAMTTSFTNTPYTFVSPSLGLSGAPYATLNM